MSYREIIPIPALQPFIKFFWTLEIGTGELGVERVFPDGCIELIFHLKTPFSTVTKEGIFIQSKAFIVGQITKAMHFLPSPQSQILALRFTPFGLAAFTNIPIDLFSGTEVAVDDIWGEDARIITERISTLTVDAAVEVLQQFLLSKYRHKHINTQIGKIAGNILTSASEKSVQYWADNANLSERQFNRNFKANVGVSPKEFIKIARFNKVLGILGNEIPANLGAFAQQCGYYDQAHFIKDFREYTGITPGSFAQDNKTFIPF